MHIMDNAHIINEVIAESKLSPEKIQKLFELRTQSTLNSITIPFVIPGSTFVYIPARSGFGGRIYVPEKAKMTRAIREGLFNANPSFFKDRTEFIFEYTNIHANLFYMTNKTMSREDKVSAELGTLRPDIKPDNDNVEKVYYDSIKEFIIYDDCSIVGNTTEKFYSKYPRIEVAITYWYIDNKRHQRRIRSRKKSCDFRFPNGIYDGHKFMKDKK